MEGSRKRKFSDGEAAHSSSVSGNVTEAIRGSRPAHQPNTANAFGQRGSGHTYTGISTSDQARGHLGDSYTVNNYHGPPPRGEDLEWKRHKTFMEALAFRRMEFREMAVEHAYATTCQWIFEEEAFLRWRDPVFRDTNRGLFWIRGKPGSGKSTLMKCVLEHIKREPSARTIASFFFNARGEALEKTTEGCYRTLLHHLFEQVPRLLKLVRIPAVFEKGQSWPVNVLKGILREAVLHLQQDNLVLIIDALDECLEKDIRDMMRFLEDLTTVSSSHGVTLWICLASRHYPTIDTRFCESLVVEATYDHTRDIREYVQDHLNVEPIAHRSLLSDQMVRRSGGVFLWVTLVVRNINEAFDQGETQDQLQDHISKIPDNLNLLIGSIIASRASDKHCLPALLWLLSGHTGMPLESLYYGIKLGAGSLTWPLRDSNVIDKATMVRFIVNVSGGLIEMADKGFIDDGANVEDEEYDEDDEDEEDEHESQFIHEDGEDEEDEHELQFIHESVRQHILTGGLASLDSRLSNNVAPESHAILLEWCQTYIQLPLPCRTSFPVDHQTRKIAWDKLAGDYADHRKIRRQVSQELPFFSYIRQYMLHHMDVAFAGKCYDLDRLYDFPIQDLLNLTNVMVNEGFYHYVPSTSLLHLLLENEHIQSGFGTGIIQGILERYPMGSMMVQHTEESAETSQKRISEICIGKDLNNYCGGRCGTPLAAATNRLCSLTNVHVHVTVQMLLDRGADPNVCIGEIDIYRDGEEDWDTPLQNAAKHADITTIQLLLDHGAKVNRRGGPTLSPLSAAVNRYTRYDDDCLQLLLDRGADINLEDSKGRNIALYGARHSWPKDASSLRWLVAHGARASLEQANGLLELATRQYRAESIRLSMQLGADPNNRDTHSRTGLHFFAEKERWFNDGTHLSSTTSLLDLGADVNALGGEYGTCLIAASIKGCEELVRLFLDRGAELHHRSGKHGTALEAAEAAGHRDICNMLRLATKRK
jgi:ankyrin repeat protein/Cdc6-like AAA superfamily ATPase